MAGEQDAVWQGNGPARVQQAGLHQQSLRQPRDLRQEQRWLADVRHRPP